MPDGRDDDALRNSDARFRLAVETLGEGVVITDGEDYLTKPIDWGRLGRLLGRYRPAVAPVP